MKCLKCRKSLDKDINFCPNCGEKLDKANKMKNKNIINILIQTIKGIFLLSIFCFLIYSISSKNEIKPQNTKNTDNTQHVSSFDMVVVKAKNCENETTKKIVIDIFKENSGFYKSIDKSTIKNITLMYPAIERYDSSIDKYYCSGTIVMNANGQGFKPSVYDYKNRYYSFANNYGENLNGYDTYKLNIEYRSSISEGRDFVQIPSSSLTNTGNFTCSNNCNGITDKRYIESEKKFKEKMKLEEESQTMIFPE